eukprot:425773-Hanusia_phi.AAC.1
MGRGGRGRGRGSGGGRGGGKEEEEEEEELIVSHAGVYFEKMLKGTPTTVWMRNIQVAACNPSPNSEVSLSSPLLTSSSLRWAPLAAFWLSLLFSLRTVRPFSPPASFRVGLPSSGVS